MQLPEEMCYPRLQELETKDSPSTMQQYAEYNQQQWSYYNELMIEVYQGRYRDHYDYLLAELIDGPYWPSIKARLGQAKEVYNPEASVSGSREPLPEDDSSSSSDSDDWEFASNILTAKLA